MKLNRVVVQTLQEPEIETARRLLAENLDLSVSGAYVRGYANDDQIEELQSKGLIVEVMPEQAPELCGISLQAEPDKQILAGMHYHRLSKKSPEFYLIRLKGPVTNRWEEKLGSIGVQLHQYIPMYSFTAPLTEEQQQLVVALDFVYGIELYGGPQTLRGDIEVISPTAPDPSLHWLHPNQLAHEIACSADSVQVEKDDMLSNLDEAFELGDDMAQELNTKPVMQLPTQYQLQCHNVDDIAAVATVMRSDPRVSALQVGRYKIRFSCAPEVIPELKNINQVSQIETYEPPELLVSWVRRAIGVEAPSRQAMPWTGVGATVGVADSGVDQFHPDLEGQIVQNISRTDISVGTDRFGHGTHICGTIAGTGASFKSTAPDKLVGIAPGAKLFVQTIVAFDRSFSGLPIDLGELFDESFKNQVRIHNNSWGQRRAQGRYSIEAFEVDQFVYDHPDFLVIVAAGNEGKEAAAPRQGYIDYNSLCSPATAKNALTVGACCTIRPDGPHKGQSWKDYGHALVDPTGGDPVCGTIDVVAAISSRGPSSDERVKPDLVAPGVDVLSTWTSLVQPIQEDTRYGKLYSYSTGTSMAAPAVSGAAAIVYQYFVEQHKCRPSAALMKATLINGTVWISRPSVNDQEVGVPNFHQGFGRLDLQTTLPTADTPNLKLCYVDIPRNAPDAIHSNSTSHYPRWQKRISIKGTNYPLKVTLAWTDRPGTGLQQDLDLVILYPDGKRRIVGNAGLHRGPFAKSDHKNNVEQVVIDHAADLVAGFYTITVLAYNTPYEPQGFSLVLTGELDGGLLP